MCIAIAIAEKILDYLHYVLIMSGIRNQDTVESLLWKERLSALKIWELRRSYEILRSFLKWRCQWELCVHPFFSENITPRYAHCFWQISFQSITLTFSLSHHLTSHDLPLTYRVLPMTSHDFQGLFDFFFFLLP